MTEPYLSVVIPAYNEEARLEATINQVSSYLAGRSVTFEILVVDDGSTDNTRQIAEDSASAVHSGEVKVLANTSNRGKGYSVRKGMLNSTGYLTLLTDSDLSTPIEEFEKLECQILDNDVQIAFGSRDVSGSQVLLRQPWYRERAGKVFNRFVRLVTGLPFKDTQCGFKLFHSKSCRRIFEQQRIDRYAFDVEVLFLARLLGLKMTEVPVIWRHAEGSKVHLFPDAIFTGFDLVRIRFRQIFGAYSP